MIILGDSTSVSYGRNEANYVDVMAKTACWPQGLTFINYSFPGATSFDMYEAFKNHILSAYEEIFGIIIYLGNCDAVSSPLIFEQSFLQKTFTRNKVGFSEREAVALSQNRFNPLIWNDNYDPKIEKKISPTQYGSNLENIIKICRKNKIKVYLVNPIANEEFPPGLGKGNCSFYHYIGLNDEISSRFQIGDERFINAYLKKERENFSEAIVLYEKILDELPKNISSREYPLVVANNVAACLAEDGKLEEAKKLFLVLLNERDVRKEIVLYNISVVERRLGSAVEAQKYKKLSYDCDYSLYRIKTPFRDQIDLIAAKHCDVKIVDIQRFREKFKFNDHCHLDDKGHQFLADDLIERFGFSEKLGVNTASVKNQPLNPKSCKSDFRDFYTFNSAFTTPPDFNFNALMSELGENLEFENAVGYSFDEKIIKTLEEYKSNPLSHTKSLLLNLSPGHQYFWGKFPEFAIALRIYQLSVSYRKLADDLLASYPALFEHLNLDRQKKFLAPLINSHEYLLDEKFNKLMPAGDIPKIIPKITEQFEQLRTQQWIPQNRIKLTLMWYVRESLRFGGQSRNDSLFDLSSLEKLSDSMFVLMLSMFVKEGTVNESVGLLATRLEKLVLIYKKYSEILINDEFEFDLRVLKEANLEKNQI